MSIQMCEEHNKVVKATNSSVAFERSNSGRIGRLRLTLDEVGAMEKGRRITRHLNYVNWCENVSICFL